MSIYNNRPISTTIFTRQNTFTSQECVFLHSIYNPFYFQLDFSCTVFSTRLRQHDMITFIIALICRLPNNSEIRNSRSRDESPWTVIQLYEPSHRLDSPFFTSSFIGHFDETRVLASSFSRLCRIVPIHLSRPIQVFQSTQVVVPTLRRGSSAS